MAVSYKTGGFLLPNGRTTSYQTGGFLLPNGRCEPAFRYRDPELLTLPTNWTPRSVNICRKPALKAVVTVQNTIIHTRVSPTKWAEVSYRTDGWRCV